MEETPDPVPGAGQVLIETAAIGITYVETQVRSGSAPMPLPALPIIPGNGVAGTVVAAGPGVDAALVGQRVATTTGGSGGYAELVAVDASLLIPIPDGLGFRDAAGLLNDGRTALGIARAVAPVAGEWVLIGAAASGVSSLLIQLATQAGARVIAAASSRPKLDLAQSRGAEVGVDYTRPGWAEQVREATGGAGVDVACDPAGGAVGRAAFELVREGGRFLAFGAGSGSMTVVAEEEAAGRGVTLVPMGAVFSSPEAIRELSVRALAEGAADRLRPVIGQTFPLERAADAHAAIAKRATLGKTLLIP
uniref:Alcohol dehydrogenase, zinc-binding n=1 Tax=Nonomuraea gerenzanensis TaxID=93944 RepID=A0A1M4DVU7_9ACTN|nr:zinc-binding dehydrogenase [Nonomuraea gerenzanensis]SBO90684.1 Alcohol dehydrogenase, zinc-binding [Nonomuraea gerenzanensis]